MGANVLQRAVDDPVALQSAYTNLSSPYWTTIVRTPCLSGVTIPREKKAGRSTVSLLRFEAETSRIQTMASMQHNRQARGLNIFTPRQIRKWAGCLHFPSNQHSRTAVIDYSIHRKQYHHPCPATLPISKSPSINSFNRWAKRAAGAPSTIS
jgi:hypothetical protein